MIAGAPHYEQGHGHRRDGEHDQPGAITTCPVSPNGADQISPNTFSTMIPVTGTPSIHNAM
jgi:hypothetical protein